MGQLINNNQHLNYWDPCQKQLIGSGIMTCRPQIIAEGW